MKRLIAALFLAGVGTLHPSSAAARQHSTSTWNTYTWDSTISYFTKHAATKPTGAVAGFSLPSNGYTALLTTTTAAGLIGNLSSKTLTATVTLSATLPLTYGLEGQYQGCTHPENARLWFSSDPTTYNPNATPYTAYWWSNPVEIPLTSNGTFTVSVPLSPGNWSDSNGQLSSDPLYAPAFTATTQNVRQIGLSFGGGCFFDTGVAGQGTVTLNSLSAS